MAIDVLLAREAAGGSVPGDGRPNHDEEGSSFVKEMLLPNCTVIGSPDVCIDSPERQPQYHRPEIRHVQSLPITAAFSPQGE
jgi:hypothetical protein